MEMMKKIKKIKVIKKILYKYKIITKIISIIVLIFLFIKLLNFSLNFDLVIPINKKHIKLFLSSIKYFRIFLRISKIIVIGNSEVKKYLEKEKYINYIDEDTILPKSKINEFLNKNRFFRTKRDCWYEQQFIKMFFSKICKKDYYLIWDSDTIPITNIKLFQNNKPFFDMKTEHHKPYFDTMKRLFPFEIKFSNRSYISEHIMVKTEYMKKLITDIENNSKLPGKLFWEKILMAIDVNDIHHSGFSEFETYGSYVDTKYPNNYHHRVWKSIRNAKLFLGNPENLNENDILWLSKDYHALSFENRYIFNKTYFSIIKNPDVQKIYRPKDFFANYKYIFRNYKQLNN